MAQEWTEILQEAWDSLEIAIRCIEHYANWSWRDEEFKPSECVLLRITPQMWNHILAKRVLRSLVLRYDGPFEVMARMGVMAYRLVLLERLKLHLVFHVSLKKFN